MLTWNNGVGDLGLAVFRSMRIANHRTICGVIWASTADMAIELDVIVLVAETSDR